MAAEKRKTVKVFRAEILKPINYTWQEFGSILAKANYASAQLANEVMTKKLLLAKGVITKDGSFCRLIETCKSVDLGFQVKCATCRQAERKFRKLAKQLLRSDISLPTFKNNALYIRDRGVKNPD